MPAVLCLLMLAAGCAGEPSDGLEKYPVTGKVLVDGEPAKGVVVRFFRDGQPGQTNADTPLGITGEDGKFSLTTTTADDGAVAGTYRVTFTWRTGNGPGASDRLGGKYTMLEDSQFEVTVKPEPTEVGPFEVQAGEDESARPASRRNPNLPGGRRPG